VTARRYGRRILPAAATSHGRAGAAFENHRTIAIMRVKLALALAVFAALLAGCSDSQPAATSVQKGPAEVSVVTVKRQSVPVSSDLAGRTVAFNTAEIRPQVGGLIKRRIFVEGTDVKAGDLLYEIDPASYDAAYQSAAATLARAKAAEDNARAKTDRLKKLRDQLATSGQDYDDAVLALNQAKADVAAADAAILTAKINLDRTRITAPIDGRIESSAVNIGALVTAEQTTALTTIRQLDPIYVEVTQPSEKLLQFRRATSNGSLKAAVAPKVHLTLEDGSAYPHTGTLQFAEASISETSGTVIVRAIFPNPEHLLLPGMYVRTTVEEGVVENSYLVPQRAVDRTASGDAVAKVVAADGKVAQRLIRIDRGLGDNWVVSGGLDDGDRVIVEGGQNAEVGKPVKATAVVINDKTGAITPVEADKNTSAASPKVQVSER
jgi:membrane fusion protein (multidrug efflux system)